jgi:hypothetical protein
VNHHLVSEAVSDCHIALVVLCELWPVLTDFVIVLAETLLHQLGKNDLSYRFTAAPDARGGVRAEWSLFVSGICWSNAVDVNNGFLVNINAQLRILVVALAEKGFEEVSDLDVILVDVAFYFITFHYNYITLIKAGRLNIIFN